MESFASRLTGKQVNEDDLPPYLMSPSAAQKRKQADAAKLDPKKKKSVKEAESLIPSNAERITGSAPDDSTDSKDPAMPTLPDGDGLFPVASALVAPDIMPELYLALSPSQIPVPDNAEAPAAAAPATPVPGADALPVPEPAPPANQKPDALDVVLGRKGPVTAESAIASMMRAIEAPAMPQLAPAPAERLPDPLLEHKGLVVPAQPISPAAFVSSLGTAPGAATDASAMAFLAPGAAMPPPAPVDTAATIGKFRGFI